MICYFILCCFITMQNYAFCSFNYMQKGQILEHKSKLGIQYMALYFDMLRITLHGKKQLYDKIHTYLYLQKSLLNHWLIGSHGRVNQITINDSVLPNLVMQHFGKHECIIFRGVFNICTVIEMFSPTQKHPSSRNMIFLRIGKKTQGWHMSQRI